MLLEFDIEKMLKKREQIKKEEEEKRKQNLKKECEESIKNIKSMLRYLPKDFLNEIEEGFIAGKKEVWIRFEHNKIVNTRTEFEYIQKEGREEYFRKIVPEFIKEIKSFGHFNSSKLSEGTQKIKLIKLHENFFDFPIREEDFSEGLIFVFDEKFLK